MRLVLTCVLGIPTMIIGTILSQDYYKSGNLIFRTVGADYTTQRMCRILFTTTTLILFNIQVTVSNILIAMFLPSNKLINTKMII